MTTISSVTPTNESGLKALIKHYPLLSMYIIMFMLAWAEMVPRALYSQGVLTSPLPIWLDLLTGWAPGIAALIVSFAIAGRDGVHKLLSRFLIWRLGLQWYFIALFLLASFILGGIGLHVLLGGAVPLIPAAGLPLWQTALIFIVTVLLGVLINTEEVAWRGFALPQLQVRYSILIAIVLLAIPEVALHLPLFWVKENPFYPNVGVFWFSAFSVAAVLIYAFIFNRTKGSLLIVTLLHASQNAWANLLSDNSVRPFQYTVALMWMVALALIFLTKGQMGYEAE